MKHSHFLVLVLSLFAPFYAASAADDLTPPSCSSYLDSRVSDVRTKIESLLNQHPLLMLQVDQLQKTVEQDSQFLQIVAFPNARLPAKTKKEILQYEAELVEDRRSAYELDSEERVITSSVRKIWSQMDADEDKERWTGLKQLIEQAFQPLSQAETLQTKLDNLKNETNRNLVLVKQLRARLGY